MKALSAAPVASLLLTACATGPGPETRREFYERRVLRANPSKVIATELAFARAAREKGQWTAFAEYAADGATMFVPEPVDARDWLKRQVNPPRAVAWQPHQVWSSCDGTLAVTRGAWQRPDGSVGYFTTVWERQRDGEYKWVMDQGDELAAPLEVPVMIGAEVADCSSATPVVMSGPHGLKFRKEGGSRDWTLYWIVDVLHDSRRTLDVYLWRDGERKSVLRTSVPPASE